MKTLRVVLTLAGTLTAGAGLAAPIQTVYVTEMVEITAPLDKVWATVKDCDVLAKWHPGFARDELISGGNGKAGAMRKLTIKDGPVVTEHLLAYDEAKHSFRYTITESPLPITHYTSTVSVRAGGPGMPKLTWVGGFKRKTTSDNRPE